jgi:hypothetical protein
MPSVLQTAVSSMLNLSLASWGKNVLLGLDFTLWEMPGVFWRFREMPGTNNSKD